MEGIGATFEQFGESREGVGDGVPEQRGWLKGGAR